MVASLRRLVDRGSHYLDIALRCSLCHHVCEFEYVYINDRRYCTDGLDYHGSTRDNNYKLRCMHFVFACIYDDSKEPSDGFVCRGNAWTEVL